MFNIKSTSTNPAAVALRRGSKPVLCAAARAAGALTAAPFAHAASSYAVSGLGFFSGRSASKAYGINDSGQVVGFAATSSGSQHTFLYNSAATNPTMRDLGTLSGADFGGGLSINDNGQVVGYAYAYTTSSIIHAFLYNSAATNPTMQDLGTLGGSASLALAINAKGQVVGQATTASGSSRPFLYSNGTMSDLNSLIPAGSGWTLFSVNAINTNGDIVCLGFDPAGNTEAFLLTPTVAPEPAALGLIGAVGFGLLLLPKRRKHAAA